MKQPAAAGVARSASVWPAGLLGTEDQRRAIREQQLTAALADSKGLPPLSEISRQTALLSN